MGDARRVHFQQLYWRLVVVTIALRCHLQFFCQPLKVAQVVLDTEKSLKVHLGWPKGVHPPDCLWVWLLLVPETSIAMGEGALSLF